MNVKCQSHRKTISTNVQLVQNNKSQSLTQITNTKLQKDTATQELIKKLANLQVLKKIIIQQPSLKKQKQADQLQSAKIRIRTEGNDKKSFHKNTISVSPNKNRNSSSPQPNNHQKGDSVSKNLIENKNSNIRQLLHKSQNSQQYSRRLGREQRNQSADFQYLLKQTKPIVVTESKILKSNRRKINHFNDHVQFSQRYGMSECSSQLELLQQQNEELRPCQSSKVFSRHHPLTTQQFKDKLQSMSKERMAQKTYKEYPDCVYRPNQDLMKTQKKTTQDSFNVANIEYYQRSRTETEQPQSRQSFILEENEKQGFIVKNKRLESKIDLLVEQVSKLNKKSEYLEMQNKMLFENLSKIFQLI